MFRDLLKIFSISDKSSNNCNWQARIESETLKMEVLHIHYKQIQSSSCYTYFLRQPVNIYLALSFNTAHQLRLSKASSLMIIKYVITYFICAASRTY